ncbi:MAG: DUF29 domain-containing protein [Microvirga sp.]
MDRRSLYDDDVYAWAKQQAAALRRLARTGRDLPNELDLENVAEEIEDVGKSELSKVESYIQLALVRLLKAASVPQARAYRKWMIEVRVFRAELLKNLTRAMRQNIDMDELWGLARLRAEADLLDNGDEISPNLPGRSPFSLEDLTAGEFDFDAAVARFRPHP